MDDIRQRDRKLFLQALLRPKRWLWGVPAGLALWYVLEAALRHRSELLLFTALGMLFLFAGVWLGTAWWEAFQNRFANARFRSLWEICEDRRKRLHRALRQLKRSRIADLQELPRKIDQIGQGLYEALRRADMVYAEVAASERWFEGEGASLGATVQELRPPVPASDPQAQHLYQLADRNLAEYRQLLEAVMAGVQRAEAQAAVFTTTLDTLRVRMLGYRLTGRQPEGSSREFLESIAEARMQLDAIDRALEELELSPFPKTIAVMPPFSSPPPPVAESPPLTQKDGP